MATRPPVVTFSIPLEGLPCGCYLERRIEGWIPRFCVEHEAILQLQEMYTKADADSVRLDLMKTNEEIKSLASRLALLRARRQTQVIAARWSRILTAEEIAHRSGLSSQTSVAKLCQWARKGFPPKVQKKGIR